MMAAADADELVPFCTSAGGAEPDLRLRGAGIDLLEGARLSSRKIAVLGVLQVENESDRRFEGERGLYLTKSAVGVAEADAAALICVLRGVNLRAEPFWGSLLALLASHVFIAAHGPVSAARLADLSFLGEFSKIQVLGEGVGEEENAGLLQKFVPRVTWVALDLKIKEMEGCESPAKYFEHRLAAFAATISSATEDVEAQQSALLLTSLAKNRDCIVVKSNTLRTPESFDTPQAYTSAKVVSHATESSAGLQPKAFFGRFLDGSQLLHLTRSLAHAIGLGLARNSPLVLKRLVANVLSNYWKLLVASAYEKYCDEMHARLTVYEHEPITGEYLIDVTERKLNKVRANENQASGSVVNAGQGNFSVFDEFGNLKRQTQTSADSDPANPASSTPAPSLNTGLFSFLKNRAGRAFTKQFSLFPPTPPGRKKSNPAGSAELGFIAEDGDSDEDEDDGIVLTSRKFTIPVETPDETLAKATSKIKSYSVPLEYVNTPSEAMPVDSGTLDRIHSEAWAKAMKLLTPFLVDLRCPSTYVIAAELSCPLDFNRGTKKLRERINKVRGRFERANDVGSAIFCAELLKYLHSVVIRKSETDNEAAQQRELRRAKGAPGGAPPLNKLPLQLLTYKANLEAMVSQYNFIARGPNATKILIGFFQGPVRQRLLRLAQYEYDRFALACDEKLEAVTGLEDSLSDKQRQVSQITNTTAEWSRQEAEAIADVERANNELANKLRAEIETAAGRVERALEEQQALYQSTMHATRRTINTIDKVAEKSRVVSGYLERYEKGHMFSKSWRQYYYVLDHATLTCYQSKSAHEERGAPFERPIVLSGYRVERSRTDDLKIKLLPPEAGRAGMLRFRAPASVGRETWLKRFVDATQLSAR